MIKFDAVSFSERRSEEVISFFWRSVYIQTHIEHDIFTIISPPGSYMYAEASSPSRAGDKARLLSTPELATTQKCVEFYYYMYGGHMGSLR